MTTAKQFAWCYLFEHGQVGLRHSFYGGWDLYDRNDPDGPIDYGKWNEFKEKKWAKIRQVGIDWSKTEAPETDYVGQFQGTFCDASTTEIISGNLILKDGTRIYCTSSSIDVSNIFEIMSDSQNLIDKYKDLL